MGQFWAHLGTSLVQYWIPCGSETGPLWAHLELILILRGSLRDPPWVKLDPNLGLVGSLVDLPCFRMGLDWAHIGTLAGPSGILDGSTLDPTWNQLGSYLDPSWPILEPTGSFMDLAWVPQKPLAPTWTLLFLYPLRVLVMGPNWTHPGTPQNFLRG